MELIEFQTLIYSHYDKEGRSFPWRKKTAGPWGVLVSEIMLQQTQTERVIPYWTRWMEKWPDPASLANAPLEEVLREWSGLGYNRRARYLRECAGIIAREFNGRLPKTPEDMVKLPGIGPYTAGAIVCFAWNQPTVFIETNIRAVFLHFFFKDRKEIHDREILPLLEKYLDQKNPRKWYWALMDYGAALKKLTANPNRKSAHYAKQSRFSGSFRQQRGQVIKSLVFLGPGSVEDLSRRTGIDKEDVYKVMETLERDLMVAEDEGVYRVGKRD
jgi:A/G-specific adenine glycosylase